MRYSSRMSSLSVTCVHLSFLFFLFLFLSPSSSLFNEEVYNFDAFEDHGGRDTGTFKSVRTLDGTYNNLFFRDMGASYSFYKSGEEGTEPYPSQDAPKVFPLPSYATADAILPQEGNRPNARLVSNTISRRTDRDEIDPINHSAFAVLFGQFVNHDLEDNKFNREDEFVFPLVTYIRDTADPACAAQQFPPTPFRCNPSDPVLTIDSHASAGVYDRDGHFKVYNEATSFLDLDTVYGTNTTTSPRLRAFNAGKLKMSAMASVTVTIPGEAAPTTFTFADVLPTLDLTGVPIDPLLISFPPNTIFTSGDRRVNENLGLIMFQTLFAREHNRMCDELIKKNARWRKSPHVYDEDIFQKARAITIAKYQHIVYEQYFPTEFGEHFTKLLGPYTSYKPYVDPTTQLVFASAAFRYGHYSARTWFALNEQGLPTFYNRTLQQDAAPSFFVPNPQSPLGVLASAGSFENVARGLIARRSAPVSNRVDEQHRSFPIPPGAVDLATFDMARGRHNQVSNYQRVREAYYNEGKTSDRIYGLPGCAFWLEMDESAVDSLACFSAITPDVNLASRLRSLYRKVNRVDAIVGMLAEAHVEGTSFGRTMGNIITNQYRRTRDGDRFFYKNLIAHDYFTPLEAARITQTTMRDILRRNLVNFEAYAPENPFLSTQG